MKIIFLDIDGVILTPSCYAKASGSHAPADPNCVTALNCVLLATGAQIVLSSAWRLGDGLMFCREKFQEWGIKGALRGKTPHLTGKDRGAEIEAWLDDYGKLTHLSPRAPSETVVDSFVILDDDSDMGRLSDRLVKIDPTTGLTMEKAVEAIKMLCGLQVSVEAQND
jgi:hypothetical protein